MTTARIDMARSALVAAEAAVGLRAPAVAVPSGVGAGDGPQSARRIGAEAEPGQQHPDPQRVVAVPAALLPLSCRGDPPRHGGAGARVHLGAVGLGPTRRW